MLVLYTRVHCTGVKHQIKLLENALSSLLLCESALKHYHPQDESKQTLDEGEDSPKETTNSDEKYGEERENREQCDALVSLLRRRLLSVLKQLVAVAMKKRYIVYMLYLCALCC